MAVSVQEFAASIRRRYPKSYDNVEDIALAQAMIKKHPEYQAQVDLNSVNTSHQVTEKNPYGLDTTPLQPKEQENFGILQPLRDATRGLREGLENQSATDFIKERPQLEGVADIATSPIGKEIARAGGSSIMGAAEGMANSAAAIYDVIDPFKKTFEEMKKAMPDKAAEIDEAFQKISGGKILRDVSGNLSGQVDNTIEESTGIDKESISGNVGGALGKAASMIPGFVAAKGVGQGIGGALGFGAESAIGTQAYVGAEESRLARPEELAIGIATDWAASKILGKLLKADTPTTKIDAVEDAVKKGIAERDAYMIADLDDTGQRLLKEYLDAGVDKLQNRAAGGVYDVASKDIGDFMTTANNYKKTLGQQLGTAKLNLADIEVPVDKVTEKIDDLIGKYNIKSDAGKLVFGDSEISNSGVQGIMNRLYNLRETANPVNARDLEALTGQIDEVIGTLTGSAPKKTPSYRALTDIKTAINQSIGEVDPSFAELNTQFAKVAEKINLIENVAKEKIGTSKQFNPSQLIRRSTSNLGNKYKEAISAMDELGALIGKDAPQNIAQRANLAELAERITQTKNATSLGGIVGSTGEQLANQAKGAVVRAGGKLPVVGGLVEAGAELMNSPKPVIEKNVARIIDFLDNNPAKVLIEAGKLSDAGEKGMETAIKSFLKDTKKQAMSPEALGGAVKFMIKAGLIKSLDEEGQIEEQEEKKTLSSLIPKANAASNYDPKKPSTRTKAQKEGYMKAVKERVSPDSAVMIFPSPNEPYYSVGGVDDKGATYESVDGVPLVKLPKTRKPGAAKAPTRKLTK